MLLKPYLDLFLDATSVSEKAAGGNTGTMSLDATIKWKGITGASLHSWGANFSSSSRGDLILDVGFGDDAESLDNYTLTDTNFKTATLQVLAHSRLTKNKGDIINFNLTVKNNNNEAKIVKEIGIYGYFYSGSVDWAQWNANYYMWLLTRKVLDNPVTIEPGETYNFIYNLRIKNN